MDRQSQIYIYILIHVPEKLCDLSGLKNSKKNIQK